MVKYNLFRDYKGNWVNNGLADKIHKYLTHDRSLASIDTWRNGEETVRGAIHKSLTDYDKLMTAQYQMGYNQASRNLAKKDLEHNSGASYDLWFRWKGWIK